MQSATIAYKASVADYLAAERTLLAWVRTGLALMGFGFVVARFGLFLQQLAAIQHTPSQQSYGLSIWFGTALIAAGVIVTLASALRHVRMVRELERGSDARVHSVTQAVAIAVFLGLVGIAMAIYLFSVRSSTSSQSEIRLETTMATAANINVANKGIVTLASHHTVDDTVAKLTAILQSKGVALFALVDHSGEAQKVGLTMPPTKLLIFGSPKAGHAPHAGGSHHRHRLAAEDPGIGRYPGQSLDFLQQPRIFAAASRFPARFAAEHRRRGHTGHQGRRITLNSHETRTPKGGCLCTRH